MYKHILVAIDGSDISNQALHEAILFCKDQKAKLRIVHVVDEFILDYNIGIDYVAYDTALKGYGEKILENAKKVALAANVECDGKLMVLNSFQGWIANKIVDEAKAWPADLIILGTHGRRGFSHLFIGSVAESIMRIAPVPVLLVRGKETAKTP